MRNYQCQGKGYLTKTLIILHIAKTESNNSFIIHFKWKELKNDIP